MANTLTSVADALIIQGVKALRQNSVTPRLVNRRLESLAGERWSSLNVPIPSAVPVSTVTPGTAQPQDLTPTSVPIQLDQWKEAGFVLSDKEKSEIVEGTVPMQATEALKSVINNIDEYILGLYIKFYGYHSAAGVSGTERTPFTDTSGDPTNTNEAAQLRKLLNKQLAPLDDRHALIDPEAEAAALNLRAFQDMSFSGDPRGIIEGQINRKLGFTWWMNQNLPVHTPGTASQLYVVNGAHSIADKSIVVKTGTGTYVEGDIIEFANHSQTYVITAAYAGGAGTIAIEPGLQSAVPDTTAVASAKVHQVNLGFHRDAIAFASRPLETDREAEQLGSIVRTAADPISGLAIRLEISRPYKQTLYTWDALYGASVIRREFGARLGGSGT